MPAHETRDQYMLQVFVNGHWHDDQPVGKAGAAQRARSAAKATGNSHRVINLSKGKALYVLCDPK